MSSGSGYNNGVVLHKISSFYGIIQILELRRVCIHVQYM